MTEAETETQAAVVTEAETQTEAPQLVDAATRQVYIDTGPAEGAARQLTEVRFDGNDK